MASLKGYCFLLKLIFYLRKTDSQGLHLSPRMVDRMTLQCDRFHSYPHAFNLIMSKSVFWEGIYRLFSTRMGKMSRRTLKLLLWGIFVKERADLVPATEEFKFKSTEVSEVQDPSPLCVHVKLTKFF